MNNINNTLSSLLKESFASKLDTMTLSEKKQYFQDKITELANKRETSIVVKKYHFNEDFLTNSFNQQSTNDKVEIINHLVDQKKNLNFVFDLLSFSLARSDKDLFSRLLDNKSFALKLRDDKQRDLLVVAYEDSNFSMFDLLIKKGWNVNTRFRKNTTLLHSSIIKQDKVLFDKLLSRNADVEIENDFDKGETPLILAAKNESKYTQYFIRTLLKHGANPNHKNKANIPPVYYALLNKNKNALVALFESNIDLESKTGKKEKGKSPLEYVETLKAKRGKSDSIFSIVNNYYLQQKYSKPKIGKARML